ncbi:MAG TPA: MmgE/PrpD family protein [Solirubrobacter sp.]|nr:MmgE/PrpD family protein [Solirubrobacter sp.]
MAAALVKLRASQLNGCACCLDMQSKDARGRGGCVGLSPEVRRGKDAGKFDAGVVMTGTTHVERLGAFAATASFEQLSESAVEALKVRVLDSLGTALGALDAEPVGRVRELVEDFGGAPRCSLIGGGRSAPDRAALLNGALVRYLDFNDAYLAPGETCHPSDNVAPVLAACEYAGAGGRDFLIALAVAYQVQCRLSDVAPVRARGFDHVTQGAYAVAAGVSRALGLDAARAANAIAIAGASLNALRVTRTGELSHWKGLAYPATAFGATHAAFLAARGITGPRAVFEGNKGFMDAIAGSFELDWEREDLGAVRRTILKRFNAEIHSQSAIEALLELREEHGIGAGDVERIELDVFQVAYDIIGGGEEGEKTAVETKEQADHSLPYLLAVALIDGQVMPAQYEVARIAREDVQRLLGRVEVGPDAELSRRFPAEHACRLRIRLRDGRLLERAKRDYEGFHTRPMSWETVVAKFERLSASAADESLRRRTVEAVARLEQQLDIRELSVALEEAGRQSTETAMTP